MMNEAMNAAVAPALVVPKSHFLGKLCSAVLTAHTIFLTQLSVATHWWMEVTCRRGAGGGQHGQ